MGLSLTEARLLALFFTDTFLGIHLVTMGMALWIQLHKDPARGKRTNWLLVIVTIIMGVVGILDATLDIVLNIRVWTTGDLTLFTERASWINIEKNVNQFVQPLIGDAILIYRCWVVYERRWMMIVVPALLWVATCVMSMFTMVLSADIASTSGINAAFLTPFISSAFSLTVALNIVTTSLIVLRIWNISRDVRRYSTGNNKVAFVVRIIIESGLLYTLTAVIILGTVVAKSNADYIPGDCLVQITGIAFNMIIIRFDDNLEEKSSLQSHANSRAIPLGQLTATSTHRGTVVREIPQMRIHVSRDTEVDKGSLTDPVDTPGAWDV
ncbi:hypothetical protein CERSUDRAFT_106312 [Gelatoporia subvermispora B]|uniref:G-protein coupled receptors family 1 profile domain-containing protein n=1 Tax=Ceriporiopsis subvermispora (strain B) TaxID=914234 RepID=M2RDC6_CERS8|nr:hypothetical protein CERSUDRAFT_106312 [Gelatoporia subvermispora B]